MAPLTIKEIDEKYSDIFNDEAIKQEAFRCEGNSAPAFEESQRAAYLERAEKNASLIRNLKI